MKLLTKIILVFLITAVTGNLLLAQSTPNIVIILADDLDHGSVRAYGAEHSVLRIQGYSWN